MKTKPIHNLNDALNIFLILHQLKLKGSNNPLEIINDAYQLREEFTNVSNAKAQNI